jgi:hypothetical protein
MRIHTLPESGSSAPAALLRSAKWSRDRSVSQYEAGEGDPHQLIGAGTVPTECSLTERLQESKSDQV